jgi:hypothetical protein
MIAAALPITDSDHSISRPQGVAPHDTHASPRPWPWPWPRGDDLFTDQPLSWGGSGFEPSPSTHCGLPPSRKYD